MGWVVNATPGQFYPRKETCYSLYRKLGGPHRRSGRVKKKTHSQTGFDLWTVASHFINNTIPA